VTDDPAARPDRRILILNRRYPRRWRRIAGAVHILEVLGCAVLPFVTRDAWVISFIPVALLVCMLWLHVRGPRVLRFENWLDRIVLGEQVEFAPLRWRVAKDHIVRFEFAPAAARGREDALPHLDLEVVTRSGHRWRLLVTLEDATRVLEWARDEDIPVVTGGGPKGVPTRVTHDPARGGPA
jgi:hypothetical protein